jgi:DNA-directed RNA polymerase II subunit RPB1
MKEPPVRSIRSVQYGILSEKDIVQLSTVDVSEITILKAGVVMTKGVNDPRLGSTSGEMLCSTCANPNDLCPGHSGHISLHQPVLNIEFASCVQKTLTCVCFHCSRVLFPPDHPNYQSLHAIKESKTRFTKIYDFCNKYRVCGSWGERPYQSGKARQDRLSGSFDFKDPPDEWEQVRTGGCGGIQPSYVLRDTNIYVVFEVPDLDKIQTALPICTPTDLRSILLHIRPTDLSLLGYDPEGISHPASMLWSKLFVPPTSIRPSKSRSYNSRVGGEDDLSLKLREILKFNQLLKKDPAIVNLVRYKYDSKLWLGRGQLDTRDGVSRVTSPYNQLQKCIAGYQDAKYQAGLEGDFGSIKKSIRDRFGGTKAKKGRLRNTLLGKRMDWSARSVITPDNYMNIGEVGVPVYMCMELTYPDKVASYNIHKLTELVRNGPDTYPGANYIQKRDQTRKLSLRVMDGYKIELEYGDTVYRHLQKGDWVLFNRQPSLHKLSLLAHKVRPTRNKSFTLHISCTKPYNADFDGDEMNLSVCLDELTKAEAQELLAVPRNMVKDGVPYICFQQHAILAAYLLTQPDERVSRARAFQILYQSPNLDLSNLKWGDCAEVSGRTVFSQCLPTDFYCNYGDLLIVNSQIVKGVLDKRHLNNGVIYTMWKDYGPDYTADFLTGTQLVLESYLSLKGSSIGVDDYSFKLSPEVQSEVDRAVEYVDRFAEHRPDDIGKTSESIENSICWALDKCRDIVGDHISNRILSSRGKNGLYDIFISGAKGNLTNLVQISGMVGQQMNHLSTRISESISHFNTGFSRAVAFGFITRPFASGLRPYEYYYHLIGSRVGLVDTAVKTSETGYCQRKLSKSMEDMIVDRSGVVRTGSGFVVQFVYGSNGWGSDGLECNTVRFVGMSDREITDFYNPSGVFSYPVSVRVQERCSHLQSLRSRIHQARLFCPVPFKRLVEKCEVYTDAKDLVLSPTEVLDWSEYMWTKLSKCAIHLFELECLFFDWLSCSELTQRRRVSRQSLGWLEYQLEKFISVHVSQPYESVGIIAAQNCSEPLTQMTLNRFHSSGQFSDLVSGVVRIREIINLKKKPVAPRMSLRPKPGHDPDTVAKSLIHFKFRHLVDRVSGEIPSLAQLDCFTSIWSVWESVSPGTPSVCTFFLKKSTCLELGLVPRSLIRIFCQLGIGLDNLLPRLLYSKYDDPQWYVLLITDGELLDCLGFENSVKLQTCGMTPLDRQLVANKLLDCTVQGIPGITDYYLDSSDASDPKIITKGSNLRALLAVETVEGQSVHTNCLMEISEVLGTNALLQGIVIELKSIMANNNVEINDRHITLIANAMCYKGTPMGMNYPGLCKSDSSIVKRAAFEKALDSFIRGAVVSQIDQCSTMTDSIIWNTTIPCGTGKVVVIPVTSDLPMCDSIRIRNIYRNCNRKVGGSYLYNHSQILRKFDRISSKGKVITACVKKEIEVIVFNPTYMDFVPSSPEYSDRWSFFSGEFQPSSPFDPL